MTITSISQEAKLEFKKIQNEVKHGLKTISVFVNKEWQHIQKEAIMHPYTTIALATLALLGVLITQNIVTGAIGLGLMSIFFINNAEKFQITLNEFTPWPKEWTVSDEDRLAIEAKLVFQKVSDGVSRIIGKINSWLFS